MALLPIVRYPDPRLRQPCRLVDDFDTRLATLAEDLAATMRAAPGIGITAAHVGILERLTVIELDGPGSLRVYINPVIDWFSPEMQRHTEGSVSMPGVTDEIERPARIRLNYRDLSGALQTEEADGLLAVCLQHEIDQLDGIFWIDRLSRLKRERIVKKYGKLRD
ncbi:peptide deformylase [Shinella curvata]|uniref:Peptide deformylase-like n=1 Tax=Shinella curvata TaxID=1817964 RepID=A0ABT8X8Y4_9HYPH|nr:peptide deformylase [Shinella curvata]MCJ8051960.1 peptide deformylase [Shinella curvata]MDO6120092.1 peptide deformylase [Shinella curvata]